MIVDKRSSFCARLLRSCRNKDVFREGGLPNGDARLLILLGGGAYLLVLYVNDVVIFVQPLSRHIIPQINTASPHIERSARKKFKETLKSIFFFVSISNICAFIVCFLSMNADDCALLNGASEWLYETIAGQIVQCAHQQRLIGTSAEDKAFNLEHTVYTKCTSEGGRRC